MEGEFTSNSVRVLVVDDHALSRRFVREALRERAPTVKTAASAAAGIRLCREWRPDVVVLDRRLPDLDGLELARRVRFLAARNLKPPRIVMLSADAPEPGRKICGGDSVDVFLVKPVSPETLLRAVLGNEGRPSTAVAPGGFLALCHADLRRNLRRLDDCLDRGDFTAAHDIAHRMIAASALGLEQRLERDLRRLQPALHQGSLDAIAAAYFAVLMTAEQRLAWSDGSASPANRP